MKPHAITGLALAAFAAGTTIAAVRLAPTAPATQEPAQQPDLPGAEVLENLVGEWDITMRIWMAGPDQDPMETSGTSTIEWVLDRQYVHERLEWSMQGMAVKGFGIIGFDEFRHVHVGSWADNVTPQLLNMTGQASPDRKKLVMYAAMDEPSIGVVGRTIKMVWTFGEEVGDGFTFEIYDLHAGDDYRPVQVIYAPKGE